MSLSQSSEINLTDNGKQALNAKKLANDAQTTADSAINSANNAYDLANGAQKTADGKNSVYRGSDPSTAPTSGLKEGDIYFTDNALYTWNGSSWEETVSDTTGAEIHEKVDKAIAEKDKAIADMRADIQADVDKINKEIEQTNIKTGNALNFYREQYYLSISYTELKGGSWSDEVPTKTPGKYVWSRYVTSNIGDSDNYQYGDPVCISGLDGETGPRGLQGLQGPKGDQGIQGPTGATGPQGPHGISSYTHIAYSDSEDGKNGFDTNNGSGKDYIGIYVDSNPTDSTDPTKYMWTLIKGEQGNQGIPGAKGADGRTPYFHIAYANSSDGTIGFDVGDSVGKLYIGQYTDYTPDDSTKPSDYSWTKIKGETGATGAQGPQGPKGDTGDTGATGPQGPQGVAGAKGVDGRTTYVHVAYANSADGKTNFNVNYFNNALYVGVLTDYNQADSTDYTKYTWSRLKGDTGATGATGAQGPQGVSSYTHIAYANSADGKSGFDVSNGAGKTYMGVYVDSNPTDSTDPTKYMWTLIKGANGAQGVPGAKGADGRTPYFHIAYANITPLAEEGNQFTLSAQTVVRFGVESSGRWFYRNLAPGTYTASYNLFGDPAVGWRKVAQAFSGFSVTESNARSYIGTYTDYTQADSTDPASYTWTKIKGEAGATGATGPQGPQGARGLQGLQGPKGDTGAQGIPGPKGANGQTTYVHFAYANSADGKSNFNVNYFSNALYVGTYTDYTQTDSNDYARYTWSRLKGDTGATGQTGATGPQGARGSDGTDASTISVKAYTYSAANGARSDIELTGPNAFKQTVGGRGHNVWVLDATTHKLKEHINCDTYATQTFNHNGTDTTLANYLFSLTNSIVVIATADADSVDQDLRNVLNQMGGSPEFGTWGAARVGHVFIGMSKRSDGTWPLQPRQGYEEVTKTDGSAPEIGCVLTNGGIVANGAKGDQGQTGATGPKGDKGDTGSTGFFTGNTPPSNPAVGTVWATNDSSGHMNGAKKWDGSKWVSTAFTQDLVAGNISASKIQGGELDVNKITVKNAQNIPITSTVSLGQKLSDIEQDADSINAYVKGSKGSKTLESILSMDPDHSSIAQVVNGQIAAAIGTYSDGTVRIDGKALHINADTKIDNATIKSAMIDSIEANKIKSGVLDASQIRVINLDANSITTGSLSAVVNDLRKFQPCTVSASSPWNFDDTKLPYSNWFLIGETTADHVYNGPSYFWDRSKKVAPYMYVTSRGTADGRKITVTVWKDNDPTQYQRVWNADSNSWSDWIILPNSQNIISTINLSPDSVKISGKNIELDGNTTVTGRLDLMQNNTNWVNQSTNYHNSWRWNNAHIYFNNYLQLLGENCNVTYTNTNTHLGGTSNFYAITTLTPGYLKFTTYNHKIGETDENFDGQISRTYIDSGRIETSDAFMGNFRFNGSKIHSQDNNSLYITNSNGTNFDDHGYVGLQVWSGLGIGQQTLYTPGTDLYVQQGNVSYSGIRNGYSSAPKTSIHCHHIVSQSANTVSSRLSVKTDITKVTYDRALAAVEGTEMYDYRYTSDETGQHYVSGIIDDINPEPQYHMDDMLINKDRTARIDANLIGYHHVVIQELIKKIDKLQTELKELKSKEK